MDSILSEVRQLIVKHKQKEAANELLALLKDGDTKILEQAKELIEMPVIHAGKTSKPKKKRSIPAFLDMLEQKHQPLLSFLSIHQQAKNAFAAQAWSKAKQLYAKALKLHKNTYQVQRKSLQNHIGWSKNGIQMQEHLTIGNQLYKQGKWQAAKESYELAAKIHRKAFPYPRKKILASIKLCETAQQFEAHIGKARHELTQENWAAAVAAYTEARQIYQKGFLPDVSTIDYEIHLCEEAIKASNRRDTNGVIGYIRSNPALGLLSLGMLLISLIGGVYLIDYHKLSTPANSTQTANQRYLSEFPKDSANIANILAAADLEETAEIQSEVKEKTKKTTPSRPAVDKVAVIPFCENDPTLRTLTANLYMDAIRSLGQSKHKEMIPFSRNEVKAVIRGLKISDTQACSRTNLNRIGRKLKATQLLVGSMEMLEQNEINLTYKLYDLYNGQMKVVIELKANNVQGLRNELKAEILGLFKQN